MMLFSNEDPITGHPAGYCSGPRRRNSPDSGGESLVECHAVAGPLAGDEKRDSHYYYYSPGLTSKSHPISRRQNGLLPRAVLGP